VTCGASDGIGWGKWPETPFSSFFCRSDEKKMKKIVFFRLFFGPLFETSRMMLFESKNAKNPVFKKKTNFF